MSSKTNFSLSIVLPSYNDNEIIIPYYKKITEALANEASQVQYELIYVDDGSRDGSCETLEQLSAEDSRVKFIKFSNNFGQQKALFAGISVSRGDLVITLDGDFQYPASVISQIYKTYLETQVDLISGIRLARQDNLKSKTTSKIGNLLIQKLLKANIQDFGSVKALSRPLTKRIIAQKHFYSDVYPAALSLASSIEEIKVEHLKRYSGKSHWNMWMRVKLYLDLYIAYSSDHFLLPLKAGVMCSAFGFALFLFMLAYKLIFQHQASVLVIAAICFSIFFAGVAITSWALTMNYLTRIYKLNINSLPYNIDYITENKIC